jgi:peptidoglycan/xylan/chitin deacetylase (PgdA/CDA1 family)
LVLAYHGVTDGDVTIADPAGLHIPRSLFERQLEFLLSSYRPVSLDQVRRHYLDGAPLPSRPLLVTFDDGYANVGRNALPLLRREGVPSAVFVVAGVTDRQGVLWPSVVEEHCRLHPEHEPTKKTLDRLPSVERRRWIAEHVGDEPLGPSDHSLMDWQELAEIAKGELVAIGSHCLSHEPLATCGLEEAQRELEESRRLIGERLGVAPEAVAYPHGSYSPSVLTASRRAGYTVGFTTDPRHARTRDAALTIPRILIARGDERTTLAARTAGWQEWVRPLFDRVTGSSWQAP